jgi:hypothetical protein
MTRRTAALVVVAGLIGALSPPANAAAKPELLTQDAAAIIAGTSSWLALAWQAFDDLSDFQVVVTDAGDATIRYPENTADHASPHQSADLMAGEIDFTAVEVTVPHDFGKREIKLKLEASWDEDGKRKTSKFDVKVPVAHYTGAYVEQITKEATVPAGAQTWVEVAYTSLGVRLDEFTVTVVDDGGLSVIYPGLGESTSLDSNASLDAGETDVVRFAVDPSGAAPGTYQLSLDTRFARGATTDLVGSGLTLTITP